jgi:hypothetical protein
MTIAYRFNCYGDISRSSRRNRRQCWDTVLSHSRRYCVDLSLQGGLIVAGRAWESDGNQGIGSVSRNHL